MAQLGEILAELRQERGMTQKQPQSRLKIRWKWKLEEYACRATSAKSSSSVKCSST